MKTSRGLACVLALVAFALPAWGAAPAGKAGISTMNVPAKDIQLEAAQLYVGGVLGDSSEAAVRASSLVPAKDAERFYSFIWSLKLARPLTTWAWKNAVISSIRPSGESVLVTATIPSVSRLLASRGKDGAPRAAQEWRLITDIRSGKLRITETESVTRTIPIANTGRLVMTDEQIAEWMDRPLADIRESLQWCASHKDRAPEEYLVQAWGEVSAATTVSLPKDISLAWGRLAEGR